MRVEKQTDKRVIKVFTCALIFCMLFITSACEHALVVEESLEHEYQSQYQYPPDEELFEEHEIPDTPIVSPFPPDSVAFVLNLLVDGTFMHIDAKDINGEKYMSESAVKDVFSRTICEGFATDISQFLRDDRVYFNLTQMADIFGARLLWIPSRETMIVERTPPATLVYNDIVFKAESLPSNIIEQIMGSSFHKNDHFGTEHLSYLTLTHVDFYGEIRRGNIIVAAEIAYEVLEIFEDLFLGGFPIARVRLIDYYNAQDYYSMADNNSVGFNFRYIAGTTILSRHALGMAVDINPVQNPYIRDETIWPLASIPYLDREYVRPGMIIPGDVAYNAFTSRGWIWGGHWSRPIDYHHFERR